ncbi:MAG: LysR family transcriptional regulator, partial [Acidobacteriia bacterium]|nr:LysR family transcriptional regulator [Terriglobia bacterium]
PLKLFETVAEEGSFFAGRAKFFRAKPATLLALKRLEDDLGVLLIDRSTHALQLPDAGRRAYGYAKEFPSLEREMRVAHSDLRSSAAGKLTIGANESTALRLLGHIEHFGNKHRGIQVELRRSLSSRIPRAVCDGSLEFGAVSYDSADPNLRLFRLYDDRVRMSPRNLLLSVSLLERNINIRADGNLPLAH